MSQENVEIVRRFLDALQPGDRDAVGASFHPEIEWRPIAGALFGLDDAIHGREESVRFMFEQVQEVLDGFRVVSEEVSALPDGRVLSVARYEGRGSASGAPVEMGTAAIYRFEAGTILSFRSARTEMKPSKPPGCGSSSFPGVRTDSGHATNGVRLSEHRPERRGASGLDGRNVVESMAGVEVAAAGTRRFEVCGKPVSVALIEGMLQERRSPGGGPARRALRPSAAGTSGHRWGGARRTARTRR